MTPNKESQGLWKSTNHFRAMPWSEVVAVSVVEVTSLHMLIPVFIHLYIMCKVYTHTYSYTDTHIS